MTMEGSPPDSVQLFGAHISHPCNAVAIALTFKEVPFALVEPPGSGWHAERNRFKLGYGETATKRDLAYFIGCARAGTEAYRELMHPIAPTIPAIIASWNNGERLKLNESSVIIEWIDEACRTGRTPSLFPGPPAARARLRLVIRVHDLNLDAKIRQLFPLLAGGIDEQERIDKVKAIQQPLGQIALFCDGYGDRQYSYGRMSSGLCSYGQWIALFCDGYGDRFWPI